METQKPPALEEGAQYLDPKDPEVRAAMREARRRVKTASDDILQQLSVAMKDEEFRERLREQNPDAVHIATERKPPPIRQGRGKYTKKKIDVPVSRKKNKAASKARRKKT